ncbi:trihelix transcription factor DF1 [Prosopis cineraria]|uniref:trihelix transcription factor DF1 n=1 Tax=Prosopis cineraria TaxID=364024 RepID=UPI00240F140A|nr:trihelix transcription factor DF1 [Prosopis cineraria]
MLGDSTALGGGGASSGEDAAVAAASAGGVAEAHDCGESAIAAAGGGGSNSGEEGGGGGGGGDRSFGGNRWPRQETLALLKIRSDMDVAFRDASVKGPLWDEVSRKLAELGYHRSAKKCKEKFENVYKYHKRTKEGRTGKPYGKTYRFFDQLEALDQHHSHPHHNNNSLLIQSSSSNSAPLPAPPVSVIAAATQPPPSIMVAPQVTPHAPPPPHANASTVPSMNTSIPPFYPPPAPASATTITANPTFIPPFTSIPTDLLSNSSSSSTSSDETIEARRKRKRKWKDFFERLMKEVIEKQEELQKKFLEAIEKREHERMAREESWRMQEMARINKEREILAQERSIAAAKDAAVMAFLQKIAEQQNLGQPAPPTNNIDIPNPPLQPTAAPTPQPAPVVAPPQQPLQPVTVQQSTPLLSTPPPPPSTQQGIISMEIVKKNDNGENSNLTMPSSASSSRWPKTEVDTLIKLRTNLDAKYQENGPKGPLWEEISAAMRRLGYNRSSKRCKEKWENINKYFKKVKESNKKRPEDSKTCPYFHQLDALYREKNFKMQTAMPPPENMMSTPLMVRPEQQWPPQPQQQDARSSGPQVMIGSAGNDAMEVDEEEDDKDREEQEDEDDDGGSGTFEIVASKPATSVGASE